MSEQHNDETLPRPPDKDRLLDAYDDATSKRETAETTLPKPPASVRDPGLGDILGSGLRTITELVENLGLSITQIHNDIDAKVTSDQKHMDTIEAMHRELQTYRQSFAQKILEPLVIDLLDLYEDIGQMIEAYDAEQSSEVASVLGNLEDIRIDIESILQRYGFELFFSVEPMFDKSVHRVQRVIPTDDSALDYQIAKRIRKGLRHGERILRPEQVEIYRHRSTIGRK